MDLHLDPVGGAAGDMFIAAILSAFPDLEAGMIESIGIAAPEVSCRLFDKTDGVFQGRRFEARLEASPARDDHGHPPDHWRDQHDSHHGAEHAHAHRPWRRIREHLRGCGLAAGVAERAVAIFTLLARAEGRVHGVDPEAVEFHEVGAWDSIADVVGAAHLIEALGARRWTVGPLPLGGGRIKTAHGLMPVPAPAAALLMETMVTIDDGVGGERVTPTGAAILRHLCGEADPAAGAGPRRLIGSGVGLGARALPGIGNILRVLVFEPVTESDASEALDESRAGPIDRGHRALEVIEFEIDDQSAEDLAMGLDRLRAEAGVLDVVQAPVFGKKGRMMTAVRLLARPDLVDAAIAAVFRETTTIGLRRRTVSGVALPRAFREVEADGHMLTVKIVERPGGRTAKAEADDALRHESHARRAALRTLAEQRALTVDQGA